MYTFEDREINTANLPDDVANSLKPYPGSEDLVRKRRVAVYEDASGILTVKRLTIKNKFRDPLFLSWNMTTKAANSTLRKVQVILNSNANNEEKIYQIFKLADTFDFIQWV